MEIDHGNENIRRGSISEILIELLSCRRKKGRKKGREKFFYQKETKNLIRLLKIDAQLNYNFNSGKKERQFAGIRARETRLIAKLYSSLDV